MHFDKWHGQSWGNLSHWGGVMHICISKLTWGGVMRICISKLTIIGSDNGLSPGRRQAIIWTNAEILLIGNLGINFSEILIVWKMVTISSQPQCVEYGFIFYRTPPQWNGTVNWKTSWWKAKSHFFYTVSTMAFDVLATKGARTSAATVLTPESVLMWFAHDTLYNQTSIHHFQRWDTHQHNIGVLATHEWHSL